MQYKMFFLTVDKELEWINSRFDSDAEAIAEAKSALKEGETVKVYDEEGDTIFDSEDSEVGFKS
jgi:hypothetical protein